MNFPTLTRRWGPWSDLLSLQDQMNQLFESSMGRSTGETSLLGTDYIPPVDVVRERDNIIVRIDVPGVKKEDLDISMVNNRLFVRGEKKYDSESDDQNAHRLERFYGTFERAIDLPALVDSENIKAKFTDGVLEVIAPLREEAKPRQIAVDVK